MEKNQSLKKDAVNNDIYETYGERWYTAFDDPVALLRAESKTKTPWIIDKIQNHYSLDKNTSVLDVGCGAGFLSNALSEAGLKVTGVDLSEESLRVAAQYDKTKAVNYQKADAYHLPFADQSFDILTAMDFLEHVEDPAGVIQEFSRVLKPGGLFIFHTFNRNPLAHLVIIKMVEWLVKNTPKHMHIIRLFIKPSELSNYCAKANMKVEKMVGIKPVFASIPIKSIFSGVVPKSLRFELTKSLMLSYMGYAVKSRTLN
ncbi:MAG: 3-demethylubiquinone-9 3-O-methyltransferase [Bdellovibrio sp.]|nr:3-demethylubiquinone-9 3-O-methyltransferase [Bdellovibrio sp.]